MKDLSPFFLTEEIHFCYSHAQAIEYISKQFKRLEMVPSNR